MTVSGGSPRTCGMPISRVMIVWRQRSAPSNLASTGRLSTFGGTMRHWMLLLLGVTACGKASAGDVADDAAASAALDSLDAAFLAAYNRDDAAGIAALHTDDVLFLY